MIKKFLIIIMVAGLCFAGVAANNTNSSPTTIFGSEVSLQVDTGYQLANDYDMNFNLGLALFPTKYFGIEVETPIYNTGGTFFNEISFGGIVRVPVDVVVIRHFAPYVRGGETFNFDNSKWSSYVGVGVETKIRNGWSLFVDGNYTFDDVTKIGDGNWLARLGLRLQL